MSLIHLACQNCGKPFQRQYSEYLRCKRKGFAISCGRTCGAILRNKKHSKGNIANFKGRIGKGNDEFSSFRYYVNKAKSRLEYYGATNLTVQFLKALWESQKGICPYTGHQMELPTNTQDFNIKGSPMKASLDRIDSSKGYIQGNVEFVCLAVNLAKNRFTRQQMLDFFSNRT